MDDFSLQELESAITIHRPLIIGIGGFTSDVGKTTLVCDLLRAFPGWEAIKTTRGHYRSCGKDPHACCVSHLLENEAVVRSGRDLTYTPGKDTGRYWDAGATNVHWVIATDTQVENGIRTAIGRVESAGVFVEGNSFTETIAPDFFIMVARSDKRSIKTSARKAMERVSVVYLSGESDEDDENDFRKSLTSVASFDANISLCSRPDFSLLVSRISELFVRAQPSAEQSNLHRAAS